MDTIRLSADHEYDRAKKAHKADPDNKVLKRAYKDAKKTRNKEQQVKLKKAEDKVDVAVRAGLRPSLLTGYSHDLNPQAMSPWSSTWTRRDAAAAEEEQRLAPTLTRSASLSDGPPWGGNVGAARLNPHSLSVPTLSSGLPWAPFRHTAASAAAAGAGTTKHWREAAATGVSAKAELYDVLNDMQDEAGLERGSCKHDD